MSNNILEKSNDILSYQFPENLNNIKEKLQSLLQNLNSLNEQNFKSKEEFVKFLLNEKDILSQVFFLKLLNNHISLYIKEYKDFSLIFKNLNGALNYNIDYLLSLNEFEKYNFHLNNDIKSLSQNKEDKQNDKNIENIIFKSIFDSSETLLKINNLLLEIGKFYETFFIENSEEIAYTKKTKDIVEYFDKNKNIFSFFLSIGVPDEHKMEVYKKFIDLYNGGFLYTHFKDQLFSILSILFNINENIKMISYITPIMLLDDH